MDAYRWNDDFTAGNAEALGLEGVRDWINGHLDESLTAAYACVQIGTITTFFGPGILITLGVPVVGGSTLFVVGCLVGVGTDRAGVPVNVP